MTEDRSLDNLNQDELRRTLAEGEVTLEEIDDDLQAEARRAAAERRPDDLPPADHLTAGGFGSGQGMGKTRTGDGPEQNEGIPDERGFPRTPEQAKDWPQ